MRRFIIGTLDFIAHALVILTTVGGVAAGIELASRPRYGGPDLTIMPVVLGVGGFVVGVLISGGILVLIEIAANTRKTVELLERSKQP